jgi:hypothetical protein
MVETRKLLAIGIGLMVVGVALPFLMVIRLLEPTLFLSFLAHGCSMAGLITGFVGVAQYFRSRE